MNTERSILNPTNPALENPANESFCIQLPKFNQHQIEEAQQMFRLTAKIGWKNLPQAMIQEMTTYHMIFAASTNCSVWSAEWDRIIEEAKKLVQQGADRVVKFIEAEMQAAGFPGWAQSAVGTAVELIIGLGQGELETGLELARYSGRLGLYVRCKWPF